MILRSVSLMTAFNALKAAAALLLSLLITRFVPPGEYGLVAFSMPFVALLSLLTDLGIANAILRERHLAPKQAGATLIVMLVLGVVTGLGLAYAADWIETYSKVTGANAVLLGFSIVTCLQIWSTVPRALLERVHDYGKVSSIEAISLIIALLTFALYLQLNPGILALVLFHIVLQGFRAILFLYSARPIIQFVIVPRGIGSLIHAGGWIFIGNLLSFAARNFDKLIIGKQLGQEALGIYGFAYQFMLIPLTLLAWPASNVLVSTMASAGENQPLKREIIAAFVCITSSLTVPMMTYLSLGLEYPLHRLLSNHWDGVHTYISILSPTGLVQSIAVFATAVLISNGQFKVNFMLSLLNGIFIPGMMFFSVSYGLLFFVKAYAFSSYFVCFVMIFFMCRSANISFKFFVYAIFPGVFATGLGVLLSVLVHRTFNAEFYRWLNTQNLVGPAFDQSFFTWFSGSSCFSLGLVLGLFLCRRKLLSCLQVMKKSRSDILRES